VNSTVEQYLSEIVDQSGKWTPPDEDRSSQDYLISARLFSSDGAPNAIVHFNSSFKIAITYQSPGADQNFVVALRIINALGETIFASWDRDSLPDRKTTKGETYTECCRIPACFLRPGRYVAVPMIETMKHSKRDKLEQASFGFEVTHIGFDFELTRPGAVTPCLHWNIESPFAGARDNPVATDQYREKTGWLGADA
jgi:hypothetical protein